MKIIYLKNKQIDVIKWDKCISNAYNGNIYGYSWFLNIVSPVWDALIFDDYRAVLPLPVEKKFGIPTLYHPILSGQLGIFSIEKIDKRLINLFLERIPHKFKKMLLRMNKFLNVETNDFHVRDQNTYVIDLIRNTNGIYSGYSAGLRQIIDRTLEGNMSVINALRPQEVIKFLYDNDVEVNKPLKYDHVNPLRRLLTCIVSNHLGNVYAVYSGVNNICALGIFLYSHNKISVPIIAVNSEGKECNACELLIHTVIFNNVEKNVTLAYEETKRSYFSEILESFGAEKKKFKELLKIRIIWPFNKLISS